MALSVGEISAAHTAPVEFTVGLEYWDYKGTRGFKRQRIADLSATIASNGGSWELKEFWVRRLSRPK